MNKGFKIAMGIFVSLIVILIIFLISFSVYNKFVKKEEPTPNNNKITENKTNTLETKYNYKDIAGTYRTTLNTYKGENDGYVSVLFVFNDNGMFYYQNSNFAEYGYFGNYIIEEDKIILNYIFGHGSGVDLRCTKDEVSNSLTIENINLISDSDNSEYHKTNEETINVEEQLYEFIESVNTFGKICDNLN